MAKILLFDGSPISASKKERHSFSIAPKADGKAVLFFLPVFLVFLGRPKAQTAFR
jgi:hypothetical protein